MREIRYGIGIGVVCLMTTFFCTPLDAAVIYYRVSEKKSAPTTISPQKKLTPKVTPVKKKTTAQVESKTLTKKPVTSIVKKVAPLPVKKSTNVPVKKSGPEKPVSASIVDFKVNTLGVEKKNVSDVVKQEVVNQAAQREEAEKKAARETLIQLTKKRSELEKEAADALLPKLAVNPGDIAYREKLKKDQRIEELYDQFSKLQSQVDSLENDIRTLSKENTPSDTSSTTGKLMSLQKTKFLLLRQQEDLLQQIELKESYITQLVELAKRDYEFTKRLYDSYMEKYTQTQSFLKSL